MYITQNVKYVIPGINRFSHRFTRNSVHMQINLDGTSEHLHEKLTWLFVLKQTFSVYDFVWLLLPAVTLCYVPSSSLFLQCLTKDQSTPTVTAPPLSRPRACWSSQKCTYHIRDTQVSANTHRRTRALAHTHLHTHAHKERFHGWSVFPTSYIDFPVHHDWCLFQCFLFYIYI